MNDTPPIFGIVAEGAADHTVLKRVLAGYFGTSDIVTNALQPLRDATTEAFAPGGWAQVLEYCRSEHLRSAFSQNEYIVIQIDTDVSEKHPSYGIPHRDESGERSPEQLIAAVCAKLISLMDEAFYRKYQRKIIFAVCVHSIECWLLPIYYHDGRKEKTVNCLQSLNEKLIQQLGFSIDSKDTKYYDTAAKRYSKSKELKAHWAHNPSLKHFVTSLEDRFQRGFVLAQSASDAAPAGSPVSR